ncbi:MAG: hypothetical protein AAGA54_33065 [Myxococcota bacterium]
MLVAALALASLGADITWTDSSGRCPASQAHGALADAMEGFDALAQIDVRAVPEGLAATVELRTPDGVETRALQSPSCETLIDATVLIVRTAATSAVVPPPPPPTEPEPEPEPDPAELDPRPADDVSPPPARAAADQTPEPSPSYAVTPLLFGSVGAFGFGTFGVTPGLGGGGGLSLGLGGEHWRADALGSIAVPTRSRPGPGIEAWAWTVGARGCGTWAVRRRVEVAGCGGAEVGRMLGDGTAGLSSVREHVDTWVALSAGAAVRVFVARGLSAVAGADAVFSVYRPGFAVRNLGTVHRPAIVAPRMTLGLEVRLPRRWPGSFSSTD